MLGSGSELSLRVKRGLKKHFGGHYDTKQDVKKTIGEVEGLRYILKGGGDRSEQLCKSQWIRGGRGYEVSSVSETKESGRIRERSTVHIVMD